MRRLICATILVAASSFSHAELIDRVAVAVGTTVITESEILRQIRLTAMLNEEPPDFSPDNKRQTAERLVEQALIRREIATSGYLPNTTVGIEEAYRQFRRRWASEAAYKQALADARIADSDIRDAFRWQLTLLDFIALRFRPGIQISEDEIREYYEFQLVPNTSPEERPSLEEAHSRIENILTEERVNAALDRWLGQTRTQTRIIYKEEVFQ
jgi:peptidyl-prolyl cis-trans isomerase SurA